MIYFLIGWHWFWISSLIGAVFVLYWLPLGVAFIRNTDVEQRYSPNVGQVAAVNGLLGWSLVGWCVALVMALRKPQPVTFEDMTRDYAAH